MTDKFVFAPIQVFQDDRLSKIQLRVLLCIISFRDHKTTKPIHPKRKTISERVGYSEDVVSRATKKLVELGWLTKTGKGGYSKPVEYQYHTPECLLFDETTLTEPVTQDQQLPCPNRTDYPDRTGRITLTEPVRRKQQTKTTNHKEQNTLSSLQLDLVEDKPPKKLNGVECKEVFEHWKIVMDHPRAVLDDKRRTKIKAALKNYSIPELKKAIDGCSNTPHNMGQNDRKQVYDSINVIFRDSDQIERFIRNSQKNETWDGYT